MPEAEEVLIDGARRAAEAVGRLFRRLDAERSAAAGCRLADHRRRLELFVAAAFDLRLDVRPARPPAPPAFLGRLFGGVPRALREEGALPATDGARLLLPPRLDDAPALPASRLLLVLAAQQACRAARGAAIPSLPPRGLARELYLLCEAAAADEVVAAELPGLAHDLERLRAHALGARPPLDRLSARERAVELLCRRALAAPPGMDAGVPRAPRPAASWRWAEATARRLEAEHGGPFRGLRHDLWLGELLPPAAARASAPLDAPPGDEAAARPRSVRLRRRPDARRQPQDEQDEEPGPWMLQLDDPHEHVEDPMGLQRPTDRGGSERAEEYADALSELPEAQLVATPERARELFVSDDPPDRFATAEPPAPRPGLRFPEWDHRIGAYRADGATVRLEPCALGDEAWAERTIARRRHVLAAVRRRFEGLRPRRERLRRQRDGDEPDLDAWVEAHAELRAGRGTPDRIYATERPRRRDLAALLLVDVSGSTDAWVGEELRTIDVEKEALLFCCHALDVLGDAYAIAAFSGEGPHGVQVFLVKGFAERDARVVRRRIAALEPERHTRVGAALRWAAAELARRRERHRLLLLLSDGRPNDVDVYEGRYGVEDARRAVLEAGAAGIHTFCLTVDRAAPRYAGRIFGQGRHAILRHARQLPLALVEVLRRLLAR